MEGYRQRQEREWYRAAWMVAYLLAPHTKKKLTPQKLLGRVQASGGTRKRPASLESPT